MIDRLQYLKDNFRLPQQHIDYLIHMRDNLGVIPNTIYDIGSCTLHWYMAARQVWPRARIICFEGMPSAEELYLKHSVEYHIDLLGADNQLVDFYENTHDPAGNSYYRENEKINPMASVFYNDSHRTKRFCQTLDNVVLKRNFPKPDLIKLDVQGAELDILANAPMALSSAKNIIAEVQSREYNLGAPMENDLSNFLTTVGFQAVNLRFSGDSIQGDAHYIKI